MTSTLATLRRTAGYAAATLEDLCGAANLVACGQLIADAIDRCAAASGAWAITLDREMLGFNAGPVRALALNRQRTTHRQRDNPPWAIFSRSAGGVFVLGGTDPATHRDMHDVWFQRPQGSWGQLNLAANAIGRVRAATFSYADHRLWIVDEAPAPCVFGNELRLLRVDPSSGKISIVASWPDWRPSHGSFWLSVDHDGSILLTFSLNGNSNVMTRLTLDNDGQLRAETLDFILGKLAEVPIVDEAGYVFTKQTHSGSLTIERRDSLTPLRIPHEKDCRDWLRGMWDR